MMLTWLTMLLVAEVCRSESGPVVESAQGKVQGFITVSRSGKNYRVFAGIPYAKPPIGDLRFKAPEPAEGWTGVRQAKEHGPLCPQVNIYFGGGPAGEEDCLYLSVFTPEKDGKYPVAVHLHGGGWILGEGPRMKGPQYLMDEDIIIVDFNYRIGILGLLSFEDEEVPGNMALKDMVMVLKWVQKNIAKFGGDPGRVTLIGECAGADAVYHLMVSPMSKGLFSRGIAESGSSYTTQAVAPPGLARQRAEEVAKLFGCEGATSKAMVDCLRTKDALELASAIPKFMKWQIDPVLSFSPVLETHSSDPFLTAPMSSWKPAETPLLTGITSGEGLLRTMFFTKNFDLSTLESDFNNRMKMTLMTEEFSSEPDRVIGKIREYYLPGNSISVAENFKNLTDMIGDSWFAFGVLEAGMMHKAPVYMYYFNYIGDHTMSDFFGNRSYASGAFHNDEAIYLWDVEGLPPQKGRDLEMSKDLVKLWTKFIKDGNPTVPEVTKTEWLPYLPGENYMEITKDGFQVKKGLITDRYHFWKSLNFRDKLM